MEQKEREMLEMYVYRGLPGTSKRRALIEVVQKQISQDMMRKMIEESSSVFINSEETEFENG